MPFDSEPAAEVTARDRVMRLRDFLASLPDERFDMRALMVDASKQDIDGPPGEMLSACGTAACVAGWCGFLFQPQSEAYDADFAAFDLGLDDEQGSELFTPWGYTRHPEIFKRAGAVAVLDHYLATGEITWDVAL